MYRYQCGGSGMFIPDPGSDFFHPGSRIRTVSIPGSRILIKEFKYFNPKKSKKWFLNSKKYDPGCSSRIPDPDADFLPSRIPDSGVKKAPNPGSRIRIRNTDRYRTQVHRYGTPKTVPKKTFGLGARKSITVRYIVFLVSSFFFPTYWA
jgi:hypothetical protein